jgi:hypothetical protein
MPKRKLSVRVSRVTLAPISRKLAPILKPKKKPRGAPFKPGNRFGISTRFKPGNNANPEGRPSLKKMNAACRDRLAQIVPREELAAAGLPIRLFGMSYAELGSWVLAQEGMRGNVGALAEIADRAEGRPGTASPDDGEQSPLAILIASMDRISDAIGPAENSPRQLKGADEDAATGNGN